MKEYYDRLNTFLVEVCPYKNHYCDGTHIPYMDYKTCQDKRAHIEDKQPCEHFDGKCINKFHPANKDKNAYARVLRRKKTAADQVPK